jgi:hypothetical protein
LPLVPGSAWERTALEAPASPTFLTGYASANGIEAEP